MENKKSNSLIGLKMKDIITLAIFNVAILIVMVIVKIVVTIVTSPAFNYLAYVGIMALFCGPLYVAMSNKVAKTGTYFVTALFSGLMMLAFGSAWFLLVMLAAGVICELIMLGEDTYRNLGRNGIGYVVYWLIYTWGSAIPLFFFKEQYLDSLRVSYTEEGLQTLVRFLGSLDMLFVSGLISVVLAALGFWSGSRLFKKHVKKAKLV